MMEEITKEMQKKMSDHYKYVGALKLAYDERMDKKWFRIKCFVCLLVILQIVLLAVA